MISQEQANIFSRQWIDAWNSHDIDRIIEHYAENIVLVSPVAERLLGFSEVQGIDAVRQYFMKGLQSYPDLQFELQHIFLGQESIVLFYINQNGVRAGEFMQLDHHGKVVRMVAHYSEL